MHERPPRAGSAGALVSGRSVLSVVWELGTQSPRVSRVQPAETCLRPGTTLHRRAREKRLRRPLQTIQGSGSVERQTGFKPPTSSFPTAGRPPCARQLSGQRPWPCRSEPPGSHDTGHCPGCGPHVDGGRGTVRTGARNWERSVSGAAGRAPEPGTAPRCSRAGNYVATTGEETATPSGSPKGLAEAPRATAAVLASA